MDDVAIIGVGQSVFARKCGVNIRELCFDAFKEAMENLDIENKDIDASITCSAPEYDKQRTPSGLISEYLELTPKPAFYRLLVQYHRIESSLVIDKIRSP